MPEAVGDDHILRIAGDRRDAADIGGERDRQHIGRRIALQPLRQIDDQRRHDETDRVIDEKGGKESRRRRDRREQKDRTARDVRQPIGGAAEEAGKAQIGDDDHHAEQQGDGVEIDGAIGLVEAQGANADHQARAEQRAAGAVEPIIGQLADREHEIGRREDRCDGRRLRRRRRQAADKGQKFAEPQDRDSGQGRAPRDNDGHENPKPECEERVAQAIWRGLGRRTACNPAS